MGTAFTRQTSLANLIGAPLSRRTLLEIACGAAAVPLALAQDASLPTVPFIDAHEQGLSSAERAFLAPIATIWETDLGVEPPATRFTPLEDACR